MRLVDFVCVMFLVMVLEVIAVSAFNGNFSLAKRKKAVKKKTECLEFVAESFRSSCNGIGFKNLDEWKTVNVSLWNLEEIGWRKEENLCFGFWNGPLGHGEVVERIGKNEAETEIGRL